MGCTIIKLFSNLSMTCANKTCPLPLAPETCVLSLDQAIEKMLPVCGFSSAYDHCKSRLELRLDKFQNFTGILLQLCRTVAAC